MDHENRPQKMSPEQLKETWEKVNATAQWMEETDSGELLVQRSDSRSIIDAGDPVHRVNFTGRTTRFKSNTESETIKQRIASCREAYENAGIVANAIDLMVDFALEGISITHENKSVERFYMRWAKRVGLGDVLGQIIKSYFVDSNVPILSFRGRITTSEVRKFRQAVGAERDKAVAQLFTDPDVTRRRVIPYKYAVLDILRLHIEGADLLGNLKFEYDLPAEDKKRLKDPSEQKSVVMRRLRDAIGDRDFNRLVESGRLRVDPTRIDMLHYKKDGYRRWANPYLWRVIDELKFKKILRDMDISVAESVINTLTIIKLGNTVEGFPATPDMFKKIAALLKTKTKSHTLIFHDLIDIVAEYPPVKDILGEEKYEQVNKEIRAALGIPEVILSGAGKGNFANSFLAVKTLIERLEGAREAVERWLEKQVEIVARAMDFRKPPIIRLQHVNLADAESQKRLALEMVDRGMLSYRTCIEVFGENFDVEIQRMKEEDTFRRRNEKKFPFVLVKTGKFGPSLSAGPSPVFSLLDSETLDQRQTQDANIIREKQKVEMDNMKNPPEPKALPTQQGSQPNSGGRPSDTKKPQRKSGNPRSRPQGKDGTGRPSGKPKATASLNMSVKPEVFIKGQKIFDRIYPALAKAFVKGLSLKDARSLRDEHKQQIYDIVASVISEFGDPQEVTSQSLETLVRAVRNQEVTSETLSESYPKLSTEIRDTVRKIVREFKATNGYLPTKTEARDIIASTYAIS